MSSELKESNRPSGKAMNGSCGFDLGETHNYHSPKWPEGVLFSSWYAEVKVWNKRWCSNYEYREVGSVGHSSEKVL